MKTATTCFEEVFAQLKSLGSEHVRKLYAQHGAGDNQFGVSLGNLRGLARKMKTNHKLALELWVTGNADAMILATMLMAPDQLSSRDIERMVKSLTYYKLVDELVGNVIAKTPHVNDFADRWLDSPREMIGRAGWNLLIARILKGDADGLDFETLLKKIETKILSAPKRKQESMNRCLVEIGVHMPRFTRKCLDLGERLGRFDKTPVPQGCCSTYAPEWIAAALKRKK